MKEIMNKLLLSKRVVILTHINEDPDALGSGFALASFLRRNGIDARLYLSENIEEKLNKIFNDKYNLYQPLEDYNTQYDFCVCVDCGDIERLGERATLLENAKETINIDHHVTNTKFADNNIVEICGATAEIIYKLLTSVQNINTYEATCLYAAISADTGSFRYSNTTVQTHTIAGRLIECGVEVDAVSRVLFDSQPLNIALLKAEALQKIKMYEKGKLAVVKITKELMQKYNLTDENDSFHGGVDLARGIENVEVAICIKERNDFVTVSMRANGEIDVSAICLKLGGGGHKKAAGASLNTSIDEAYDKVVAVSIEEVQKFEWNSDSK